MDNQNQKTDAPTWRRRLLSRHVYFFTDLTILVAAFAMAYLFRFDFSIPAHQFRAALIQLPYVILIQSAALSMTGVYSFIWRYIGMAEIKTFLKAACLSFAPPLALRLGLPEALDDLRVPLSVIVMNTLLGFGGVLGARVARRAFYEASKKRKKASSASAEQRKPVLLIGAGRLGALASQEIQNGGGVNLEIKGFIDDDRQKQGSVVHGVKVLGTTQDLPRLVRELDIDHVILSLAEASRMEFRRILNICRKIPVTARILPGLSEILQGKVKVSRIRDVQIEDLLGRETVVLDENEIGCFLGGKTVMVTGAGGSIGSELVRQAARFNPAALLLVDRAEFALFEIDHEMKRDRPELSVVPLVADVGDEERMRSIFATYRPQVVLHAAAHKHVPMMELNTGEAVKNNVLATYLLGELAGAFAVEVFVLISTDKAVRPKSVMGATKRVAELVIQDLDRQFATSYVAVRFGNVMGSAGSVIPIFREQICRGGPITVTHPDMVRYFMTIPEAAQLVLQAGAIGEGGEIFILDMGEPVRILDLALDTITLSGLRPFDDINVVFTGLRPGEKLFEELEITEEHMTKTGHPKIFIGKIAAYPEEKVRKSMQRLALLSVNGSDCELRCYLNELLPEAQVEVAGLAVATASTSGAAQPLFHQTSAGGRA